MSAYLIADIQITDPQAFEEYRRQVPAIIAAYGGRYLVRGGDTRLRKAMFLPVEPLCWSLPIWSA